MKIGVLITVGLSFFENLRDKLVEETNDEWDKIMRTAEKKRTEVETYKKLQDWFATPSEAPEGLKDLILEYRREYSMDNEYVRKNSAELATLENLLNKLRNETDSLDVEVWLIPTKKSEFIAKTVIKRYLEEKGKGIRVEPTKNLLKGVIKYSDFRDSVDMLAKFIKDFYSRDYERYYIIVSGGYKGFIPLLSILGMIFPDTYIVYMHERSDEAMIYPPLPVTPDFPRLDAMRSIILRDSLNRGEYENLKSAAPFIELFFEDKGNFVKTMLGELFSNFYQSKRAIYGKGENLLKLISDESLREAIEKKLNYWEYLWIGDQIPETVEHSRKHSLRLLEYAGHLLNFFPEIQRDLSNEGIAILYSSIWLHDLGHGVLFVSDKPSEDTLPFKALIEKKSLIRWADFVALNPEMVRKYHNVYTVNMLQSYFEFLLPKFDERLRNAIKLACLYHRRKFPLYPQDQGNKVEAIPLRELLKEGYLGKDDEFIERVVLASAILAFVDGLDVQTDRIVSKEYKKVREIRDQYEIDYHWKCFSTYRDLLVLEEDFEKIEQVFSKLVDAWKTFPENSREFYRIKREFESLLSDSSGTGEDPSTVQEALSIIPDAEYHLRRILFIINQKEHFMKHSLVDWVYLSKIGEKELGINLVESEDVEMPEKFKERLKNDIKHDIEDEYNKRKEILGRYFKIKPNWVPLANKRGKNSER